MANIYAQDTAADSVTSPFARPDTLVTQRVLSKLYWYSADHMLRQAGDSSAFELFRIQSEKDLIYTDISDVIRSNPLWHDFDLFESGRPAYLAHINKFPHQTAFFVNDVIVNDPIYGMYNTHFLPVNFTKRVEGGASTAMDRHQGFAGSAGLHFTSNSLHTKAPWTRLLYKEGPFGYSDLDISFVQPINEFVAVQLGGVSKVYDGTFLNADHSGQNYRGELTWQFDNGLYARSQFFISRQRTGMTPFDIQQPVIAPKYIEWRDDYLIDLTWLPQDTTRERLHLSLSNTYTFRRFKNTQNTAEVIKSHAKQYRFDANYLLPLRNIHFFGGTGFELVEIHGSPFTKEYHPNRANMYLQVHYPLASDVDLKTGGQLLWHDSYDFRFSPLFNLDINLEDNHLLRFSGGQTIRFPTASEMYFEYDSLYGNPNLSPEKHLVLHGDYSYRYKSRLWFQLSSGFNRIQNEIQWQDTIFFNNVEDRSFSYIMTSIKYRFWKIEIEGGGQYTFADEYLTPKSSAWGKIHFHDVWLGNAITVDAYGAVYAFGQQQVIRYEGRLERFYPFEGNTDAFLTLAWKIVATVKTARIFFEMDNPFSERYEFVDGYPEQYIRWRFGVNWVLWD